MAAKTEDKKDASTPLTISYSYDDAGRMSADSSGKTYSYDDAGRLTSVTQGGQQEQFAYDGLSRLISGQGLSGEATYYYDSQGRMVIRSETGGSENLFLPFGTSPEVGALYTDGTLAYSYVSEPTGKHLSQEDGEDNITYPFRSPRSDVLALVSTDGNITDTYAYEPFGEMEDGYSAGGTPFLFQDDYLDQITSFYQMQARWYSPDTALFLSTDPKMGDAGDPSLRSPYAYCADDPVYNADASGQSLLGTILGFGIQVLSALTILQGGPRRVLGNIKRIAARAIASVKGDVLEPWKRPPRDPNYPAEYQPDYDPRIWNTGTDLQDAENTLPNLYTQFEWTPTGDRPALAAAHLLLGAVELLTGALAAQARSSYAYDLAEQGLKNVKRSWDLAQTTGGGWTPTYWAHRTGLARFLSELLPRSSREFQGEYYTQEMFAKSDNPKFGGGNSTLPGLPPGARIVVTQGAEEFDKKVNRQPYDPNAIKAIAYPPYFYPDETMVLESMSCNPSYVVDANGLPERVN